MALVADATLLTFLGLSATNGNVTVIKASVEAWVQTVYCRRAFESTSYKERYDGTGDNALLLDYYPIISLNLLSIGEDEVISIKNTNTTGTASVSVSSTAVSLYRNGVTTSLTFAAYSTMTTLVAAINATSGWSATLTSSTYGDYSSSLLLKKFGLNCINNNYSYLTMPDDGEDDFEVYPDEGKIVLHSGFPVGSRNIYVDYVAGYATIPDDLQLATMILIKNIYQRRSEEVFGVSSYSVSGISNSFEQDLPKEAKQILNGYRKNLI